MAAPKSRPSKGKQAAAKRSPSKPRVRKFEPATHRSFKLSKRLHKLQKQPIIGPISLLKQAFGLLFHNKKLFFGIAAIHVLLLFVFVQGFGSLTAVADVKQEVEEVFGDDLGSIGTTAALFG